MKRKFPGFDSLFQFVLGVVCINGKFTVVNPVLIALVYLATSGSTRYPINKACFTPTFIKHLVFHADCAVVVSRLVVKYKLEFDTHFITQTLDKGSKQPLCGIIYYHNAHCVIGVGFNLIKIGLISCSVHRAIRAARQGGCCCCRQRCRSLELHKIVCDQVSRLCNRLFVNNRRIKYGFHIKQGIIISICLNRDFQVIATNPAIEGFRKGICRLCSPGSQFVRIKGLRVQEQIPKPF